MPRVVYELTAELNNNPAGSEYGVTATIEDGVVRLVVEYNSDDEDLLVSADAAGDEQSDMLWKIFNHNFTVYDDDGYEIEYDD